MSRLWWVVSLVSLMASAGFGQTSQSPAVAADGPPDSALPATVELNLRKTVTVRVVAATKDAVVNISSTRLVERRVGPGGAFGGAFDFGEIVRVPTNSLGSGFIIHPDGYVVTNHHVIDKAVEVTVELSDGRKAPARLISSDPESDLAVLRIIADEPFPTLQLGDSSDLLIGEPVIAVGNPLGYSHSVSTGIISAIGRDLKDDSGRVLLSGLVQTDAAINPGNSGGPLLNAYGQVIGINTAIRGDAQNIGFAVPVSRMRDLIPDLMSPAGVRRLEIGMKFREERKIVPPASVQAWVVGTDPAGKQVTVESIDGTPPADIIDLYARLLRLNRGDGVAIRVRDADGGESRDVRLDVRDAPLPDAIVQARERLGLGLEPLSPEISVKLRLSVDAGLLVSEVVRGSPAAEAGIQPGDVIIRLGRYPITDIESLAAVLKDMPERVRVGVGVVRGNTVGSGVLSL